jgi:hypothetical protein
MSRRGMQTLGMLKGTASTVISRDSDSSAGLPEFPN